MSEHTEQAGFFQWCENHERYHPALARFFAVPNGGHRHVAVAKKLKAEGVRAGVSDVFNLTPVVRGKEVYRGLVLEFKVGRNKPTPEQEGWISHFREVGMRVEVPYSWIEAALITIDYFGLPAKLKNELPAHRMKAK